MAAENCSPNPLILNTCPIDTINNVDSVLAYLEWVREGTHDSPIDSNVEMGEFLILGTCREALKDAVDQITKANKATRRG